MGSGRGRKRVGGKGGIEWIGAGYGRGRGWVR